MVSTAGYSSSTLRGRLPDGAEIAMPAAMYLTVSGGRVRRIEEYLDSAQAAPIRAASSAWIHRRNGCVDRVVTGQMPSDLG